jgi:hypothetical protein
LRSSPDMARSADDGSACRMCPVVVQRVDHVQQGSDGGTETIQGNPDTETLGGHTHGRTDGRTGGWADEERRCGVGMKGERRWRARKGRGRDNGREAKLSERTTQKRNTNSEQRQ